MLNKRRADKTDKFVGERVRALRIDRDLSQTDLGEKIGVTFQQVQKYEKGTNRIGASRLTKIAEVYRVPVSALLPAEKDSGALDDVCHRLSLSRRGVRMARGFLTLDHEKQEAIVQMVETFAASPAHAAAA